MEIRNKVLVTGGSGFIGTNLIDYLINKGYEVKNFDIKSPQNQDQNKVFEQVDILNKNLLYERMLSFCPDYIVHLAAKTDLETDKTLEKYKANTDGVKNVCETSNSIPSIKRILFTSTKLVCPTDYEYKHPLDFHPTTSYGESKVIGEKIVRDYDLEKEWCIVRPTSIWGPWSLSKHIPYGRFFQYIDKGYYIHPSGTDAPKTYGFVGNACFQLENLLFADKSKVQGEVFFLLDYETFIIKDWANLISVKLKGKKVKTLPKPIVDTFAKAGDILKLFGYKEPPFSTFRLNNMKANTSKIPFKPLQKITGRLPYNMEEGVEITIKWLRDQNEIQNISK